MPYLIGPIEYRNVPAALLGHFEAFAARLAEEVKTEFGLKHLPEVVPKSYSSVKQRVEVKLNAPLVGKEYGKLLVLISRRFYELLEAHGLDVEGVRVA